MLAAKPIAATIGYGTKAYIFTPCSMDHNGNANTVSNDVWGTTKLVKPSSCSPGNISKPVKQRPRPSKTLVIKQARRRIRRVANMPMPTRTPTKNPIALVSPFVGTVVALIGGPIVSRALTAPTIYSVSGSRENQAHWCRKVPRGDFAGLFWIQG